MMDREDDILDYVQERLDLADREAFEKAMAKDKSLAAEVDLMRSVRAELQAGTIHENADAVWDELSATIDAGELTANDNRRPRLQVLQYAAVAAVAIATWQFAVVPRMADEPVGFQTASDQSTGFVLQVKFTESATIAEITDLLRPLEGTITDGPSALGLVRVSFPEETLQQDALDVFSSRTDLVELALEQ